MAQLLLISSLTANPPSSYVNDFVGVFDDKHIFSGEEKRVFNIAHIEGGRADVQTKLQEQLKEDRATAFKSKKTNKWAFTVPEKDDLAEETEVWKSPINGKWYFLEKQRKHSFSFEGLSFDERTIIEVTLPNETSVEKDIVYEKMCKQDLSEYFENGVEVTDINNLDVRNI